MNNVKVIIFVLLIATVAGYSRLPNLIDRILAQYRERINKQLANLLENQRDNFSVGWPQYGIPPLDPLFIGDIDLSLETISTLSSVDFRLTEAYLKGLQKFEIENLQLKILFGTSVAFDFHFNELTIEGRHSTRANLAVLPISGEGPVTFICKNVKVKGKIEVNTLKGGYLNLKQITSNVNVDSCNVDIRGFGNLIDNTVSALLSNSLPALINESSDRFNDLIDERFIPKANGFLNQYRMIDLLLAIIGRNFDLNLINLVLLDINELSE